MLPSVVELFRISFTWTFVVIGLLLPVQVQPFNSSDDYELGWFTTGPLEVGEVLPICTYCVNALGDESATDAAHGPDWNRTVGLYRCDGAQPNEVWAYQNSTSSIVFSRVAESLCLDALLWKSQILKLRPCDPSVVTQHWKLEGQRLINGLVDNSTGQNFSLWAAPPQSAYFPSLNSTFPLFIASSAPYDNVQSRPYTSNFTLLPTTNLVDNQNTDHFTTQGLLQISNTSVGQISNGDFETSSILAGTIIQASSWNQSFPSYFALCGWVIDYGPIDYVAGFLTAAHGSYSIHLNTKTDVNHIGSISQTFRTETGQEYALSFYLTGFPPQLPAVPGRSNWECNNPTYLNGGARLQVQVTDATTTDTSSTGLLNNGTALMQNFTSNVTVGLNRDTIAASWMQKTVIFRASTNVTTISFSSLNFNDSCGPMIDMVGVSLISSPIPSPSGSTKVVPAVAGSIGGLAGLLAILGILYGIRTCRDGEDHSSLYKTEHARIYTLKELSSATKKFSKVLGEGGFGTVYKADFPDGTVGAVKVEKPRGLNSSSKVLASEEIAVLLRVHHRNLVNLIGFSIPRGRHMLVFEYLPNGSLYDRLHQSVLHSPRTAKSMDSVELRTQNVIQWKQRVRVAADVACGLEYLHHEADPPIVHRDVKSQNILLTIMDSAKLADFGLSKAAPVDATSFQSIETVVKGSIGYLDPQYLVTGVFSPKSDVYSFGVVLLELISGHQAIYNAASLASWAAPYIGSPSLYHELVDKRLYGDFHAGELETLVDLSKMCMQGDSKMRPNMRQVVAFLNSKQLPSIAEDSSQWMEATPSSESYRDIYEAMFIDFEAHRHDSYGGDSLISE